MPSPTRLLFVGFDACDPDIALGLCAEGSMPTLARLLEEGATAPTHNPDGLYVGAVWPTFATGVSPARHGRYCYEELVPGSYEIKRTDDEPLASPPFWDWFGEAGRRIAVVDVPIVPLSSDINGCHVVEWGSHDASGGLRTNPPELAGELVSRHGRHPVPPHCDGKRRTSGFMKLRRQLLHGAREKGELAASLLRSGSWDAFVVIFSESHCAGHQTWHLHDPTHPRHTRQQFQKVGDALIDTYRALDAALGRVLEEVDDDTVVLLLLSHGMGPHHDATHLLDLMLRRLERADRTWLRRTVATGADAVWDLVPWSLRSRALGGRGWLWTGGYRFLRPLDPATRPWFPVPNNDAHAGVRLNLIGREPKGTILPDDYDSTCDLLAKELQSFVNRDTGSPIVDRIIRPQAEASGPFAPGLPDLVVEWRRDAPIQRVWSPHTGPITTRWRDIRTGDHRSGGRLVARGPGITSDNLPLVDVVDLAPTIAAICDVTPPSVEGRALTELFRTQLKG